MSNYCQQVDLTIVQNWEPVKSTATKLFKLKNCSAAEPFGASDHYDLGSLGLVSDHRYSDHWLRVAGPVINKTMPWINDLLFAMKDLTPDEGCISFLSGPGTAHIDLPYLKTALNYIFESQDENAVTWVDTPLGKEFYPSRVNTAWILDTQQQHGIDNKGDRWSLSIHFGAEYNLVRDWFMLNQPLIFGKENE